MTLIFVALGGAVGSVLRFLTVAGATRAFGAGFPFGTLGVNVLGSLLMGVLFHLLVERSQTPLAPGVTAGLLGGFTTFSAFSLETVQLLEAGRVGAAALYILASVVLSLGALMLGLLLARGL